MREFQNRSNCNITLLISRVLCTSDSEQGYGMSLGKQVFFPIISKVNALLIIVSPSNRGFDQMNQ